MCGQSVDGRGELGTFSVSGVLGPTNRTRMPSPPGPNAPKPRGTHLFPQPHLELLAILVYLVFCHCLDVSIDDLLGRRQWSWEREEVRELSAGDQEGVPLRRGSPQQSRCHHSPPGSNSGSGLVSPVARGIPLRSSLVTHLSRKGSVGRRAELEEWELPS